MRHMTTDKILPTLLSVIALVVSAYGLYESSLAAPQLAIYVAPRADYTDPDRPEAVLEVFVLPVTVANHGARASAVHAINLEVTNPRTKQVKRFYAARLGAWGETPIQPFTPVALAGKGAYSAALQFFPRSGEKVARILDLEAGSYDFRLWLETSSAGSAIGTSDAVSVGFQMQIGQLDYSNFQGKGTMEMWAPDYRSASSRP